MKSKMKKIILSLVLMIFGFSAFVGFSNNTKNEAVVFAASPTYFANQKKTQKEISVNEILNGQKVFYLYPNSNGVSSIVDCFSYYNTVNEDNSGGSSTTELVHYEENPTQWNIGTDDSSDAQFVSVIDVEKNIQIAIEKGFVSLSSSVYYSSTDKDGSRVSFDKPEKVTYTFLAYDTDDANDPIQVSTSAERSDYASSIDTLSIDVSKLNGQSINAVSIMFQSELKGWGVANYMKIKQPSITFNTTDKTAPTISLESPSTNWAKSRTFKLTVADENGSGVQKVEVSVNGGAWEEIDSFDAFVASKEVTHTVTENGSYKFRVTDNVGNVKETSTYAESKIDTTAPSIVNASAVASTTSKQISISTDFVDFNATAPETLTYKVILNSIIGKDLTETVELSGNAVDGTFVVNVPENGNYTIEISAVDEAGNQMETYVIEDIVLDIRPRVSLTIAEEYTYSPSGLELAYEKSIDDDYQIKFRYFSENGENEFNSLSNVGTYKVTYLIDDYNYFGEGSQIIKIIEKEITISNMTTDYYYNEQVQSLDYEKDVEVDLIVSFTANEQDAEFKFVGTYQYVLVSSNSNYVVANGTGTVQMHKTVVTIENIKASYVYDATEHFVDFSTNIEKLKSQIVLEYYYDGTLTDETVNAGNYAVVFSFVGDTNNYDFASYTTIDTALTMTIEKRNVSVKVNSQTITYGDALETLSYQTENLLQAEPLTFDLEENNLTSNAGYYNITIKQSHTTSAAEDELFKNYNITFENGFVKILKKSIEVVPVDMQSKIYGKSDSTLAYNVSGLVGLDSLSGELAREPGEDAGYYNITIGTLSHENYDISLHSEVFEIVKRTAFIIVEPAQKTYGDADPTFTFMLQGTNIIDADIDAFKAPGLISREAGENVGEYAISFSASSGVFDNYVILAVDSVLEIKKAKLSVVADSKIVTFGSSAELSATVSGLKFEDSVQVVLNREIGENVGTYAISMQRLILDNYEVEYVSANYEIVAKPIEIKAKSTSKIYGDIDNLEYEVVGALEDLTITLTREAGENVGSYAINGYEFSHQNYVVENFVAATYEIKKAKISVTIADSSKIYGEADAEFTYQISGLKFDDELILNIERNAGENAGSYKIFLADDEFDNYEVETVIEGVLEIKKATLSIVLADKVSVYSGKPIFIDAPEYPFEISYTYTLMGAKVENPTVAGDYEVVAFFAGNENYNEVYSNTASFTIEKKYISITLKTLTFLYNGRQQAPEYEINLDETISVLINYDFNILPVDIGEYNFTFESNDANYYADTKGTLKIVGDFSSMHNNGSSVSSNNVSDSGSEVKLVMKNNSTLMQKFNPLFDGIQCVAVYEFANAESFVANGDIYTVKLKAVEGDANVEIYTIDKDGNMIKTLYSEVDGYYVFSVNSLSGQFVVTKTNNWLQYAKVIAAATVLILCFAITKGMNKRRHKKFLKNNTKVTKLDVEEVKANIDIVAKHFKSEPKMSLAKIINDKK